MTSTTLEILKYVAMSSVPVFSLVLVRDYHNYYVDHRAVYSQAEVYSRANTCMDSSIRAKLGDFNLCKRAARILAVPPWMAAGYDVVEDLRFCGHGRCQIIYQDFTNKLPWIILFIVIGAYALFRVLSDQRHRASEQYWSLPERQGALLD